MAEPTGAGALMTSKWGPAPVWLWAAGGLVLAWVFAKYRDLKSAASGNQDQANTANATGDYASEGQAVAPQFIIENNMPQDYNPAPPATPGPPTTTPSQPVKTPLPQPIVTGPGTTTKPPVVAKPVPKPPATSKKPPLQYKVVHGDSLSSIAAKHKNPATGKPFTWQELWTFNTTPGNRPASTISTLKQRGPNTLFAGETILIPQ